ncbi:MAG: DUF1080 domain-containing protein [Verrucomicrobiaceae bacterium]|nr:DUF1080 domain-containing protein [Verrucomicrobiaceae bacterium]
MKPIATLLLIVCCTSHAAESLFDGTTLTHWSGKPEHWRVEDGAITGEIPSGQMLKGNEWIFWDGEVHDFDFKTEFRISGGPSANSGIQFRCQQSPQGHASGYQADLDNGTVWLGRIYDEHGRALITERGTRVSIAPDGRRWVDVFAEAKSLASVIKPNEWNTYQITATASHVEVRVNGTLMSVLDDHEAQAAEWSGKIAFQLHSGPGPAKIQFRNIQLEHLGRTEIPKRENIRRAAPSVDVPGIPPPPELNLGFEQGTLEGWKAEGNAWDKQPIEGDTVATRKRGNSRHEGRFWLGGYERLGDNGTGTLTSNSFDAAHPWASFLVGAGRKAKVEIVDEAEGKVLASASGEDREDMRRVAVDLTAAQGRKIIIRITDGSTQGWGHINFDDFVFHAQKPKFATTLTISGDRSKRADESPVLWHLTPNPVQDKLVAGMKLTAGFQAELIAAEPTIAQPIAFCFDERGRIWVAEAFSYPNRQPEGQGKDRISILEDADGDGKFETHKVFCEGLNLVSGIEVGFGGVWVGAAPHLLFIPKDENDKSGEPKVLLDGFGYQDTHETLNSFLWGPDGWLYGNQGVFNTSYIGKPGTPQNERITMRAGVWRYHPVRHVFEVFCHGGSNQWGLDYNSNGHLFMTHCRSYFGKGGTTNAIRNGHFWNQANAKYAPFISATAPAFAPDLQNYLPASAKYDSGEGGAGKPGTTAVYGGHSHVGTMIYNGNNWPAIYRDHLFTHNLHGHQMNHQHMVREGSGYETLHAGYDLMFNGAENYIPVDLQTGPDGAVYVIDWCDTQHCHNPDDEKWDRSNGRIYRISWKETYKSVKVDLTATSSHKLANLADSPCDWSARTARRIIHERKASIVLDTRSNLDLTTGKNVTLGMLWTLNASGDLDADLLTAATGSNSDIIRAWAIQLATEEPNKPKLTKDTLLRLAQSDPAPVVRLAVASAMPALPEDWVFEIGSALAMHAEDKDDRFLPKMIWFGLARAIANEWKRGLELAQKTPMPSLADSICWYAATTPTGRDALMPFIKAERDLQILAFGIKDEASVTMPTGWSTIGAPDSPTKRQLSAIFGDQQQRAAMRIILTNSTMPATERRAAFDLLRRVGDPESTAIFVKLLDDPAFATDVIPLLSRSSEPATANALIERLHGLDQASRIAALATLTSRAELALPLLHAIEQGKLNKQDLTALQIRQLRNLNHAEINKLLDAAWGKVNESSSAAKAIMAKLKQAYESAPLWAFNAKSGEETFKQLCSACHAINGVGGKLGPDLAGSWRNGLDYFLENIVDPNAVVGDNFQLHILTKKDGTVVSGVIEQESETSITARTITEQLVISKADLKSRQKLAASLMPPGLLETLPERKALELLKFLLLQRQ